MNIAKKIILSFIIMPLLALGCAKPVTKDVTAGIPSATNVSPTTTITTQNDPVATSTPTSTGNAPILISNQALSLQSIQPTSGPAGTVIIINGNGFTFTGDTVNFSGSTFAPVFVTTNKLTFTMPTQISPQCKRNEMCPNYSREITAGNYPITVSNSSTTSNALNFTVTGGNSDTNIN